MDGLCYQCAEKFGFFRKEYGCKRCGHSFCKTCLPYKAVIPGKGTSEQQVCKDCNAFLKAPPEEQKQNKQNEGKYSPPENYKKRVAAYNAKQEAQGSKNKTAKSSSASSASSSSHSGPDAKRYKGLSEADRNLAQRLDRLKEERRKMRGRVASVEEMEDRLKKLKGLPQGGASTSQQPTVYQPPDPRTSQQQSDDLITEIKEEAAIDARVAGEDLGEKSQDVEIPSEPELQNLEDEAKKLVQEAKGALKQEEEGAKKDDELAARVAKLKGIDSAGKDTGIKDESGISEEEASKRLITQLMEETKLEDKISEDGFADALPKPATASEENKPKVDPDELPWCCICNEDATLRCHGCDEDLYCARCFREGHDQFDLPEHKTVRYKPPKNRDR